MQEKFTQAFGGGTAGALSVKLLQLFLQPDVGYHLADSLFNVIFETWEIPCAHHKDVIISVALE